MLVGWPAPQVARLVLNDPGRRGALSPELFLLAAPLSAERGHALGVIDTLVEPAELESAALRAARRVATHAPLAQRGNVRALRALLSARPPLPDAQRVRLASLRHDGLRSQDFVEGIEAFRRRREPVWRGS